MAKKKPNQITIAAILAILAILLLTYLSHTGYATMVREMMGPRHAPTPTAEVKVEEPAVAQEVQIPFDLEPEMRIYYNTRLQQNCVDGYVKNVGPGTLKKGTFIVVELSEDVYVDEEPIVVSRVFGPQGVDRKTGDVWLAGVGFCQAAPWGGLSLEIDVGNNVPETNENNNIIDVFNKDCSKYS